MNQSTTPINPSPVLIRAVRGILYSLVRLLLNTGITFPQLSELLKEIYVDVADRHFRLEGKKQTQTRLSFLTGVHRKDVKRLQSSQSGVEEPTNVSIGVKLISRWLNESQYLDEAGKPLILPLKSANSPSFESLVEELYKQDMRPRVILDEWVNLGVVKVVDKQVQLCAEAFVPQKGLSEKAFFLGRNISDHLSAASKNLLNDSPQFFERCVYYDDLSDDSIAELEEMVRQNGMDLLIKLNNKATLLKQKDNENNAGKQRINIGLYLYHEQKS